MTYLTRYFLLIPLLLVLASCSATGPLVEESFDPGNGATVLRATKPLVLYRDNSAYAAFARDFVYLGPVEVNSMGSYDYYLWLGVWSTMRDNRLTDVRDGFETVVLLADGQPIPLEFSGWTLDTIGVTQPVYVKPVAGAADAYYRVTIDQIRLIAAAREIDLRVGGAGVRSYGMWDQQDSAFAAMRAFLNKGYD